MVWAAFSSSAGCNALWHNVKYGPTEVILTGIALAIVVNWRG